MKRTMFFYLSAGVTALCVLVTSLQAPVFALAPRSQLGAELMLEARMILAGYGITQIFSIEELSGGIGSVHKPLLVRSSKGDFVLRRWPLPREKVRFIVSVTNRLAQQHVPVAGLVRKAAAASGPGMADDYITEIQGDHFVLETYMAAGRTIRVAEAQPHHLQELAAVGARINNALADFTPEGEKRWKPREQIFEEVQQALLAYGHSGAHALFAKNTDFIQEQMELFRANYDEALRRRLVPGIVHNDLHCGNVKFNDDGEIVAVMDLGFAQSDVRILEFNNLVLGMDDLLGALPYSFVGLLTVLRSYQRKANRKLGESEVRGIIEILRLRFLEDLRLRFAPANNRLAAMHVDSSAEALQGAAETLGRFRQFAEDFKDEKFILDFVAKAARLDRLDFETHAPVVRVFGPESTSIALSVSEKAFDASGQGRIFFDRVGNHLIVDGRHVPWSGGGTADMFSETLAAAYLEAHPDMEIVAILPNGNLGFNDWFVGIANGKVYRSEREDLAHRSYDMLVVAREGAPRVMTLRFVGDHGQEGVFDVNAPTRDIRDQVLYAVYGQHIVKDGAVNLEAIAGQFDDLRHLFRMPMFSMGKRQLHLGISDDEGELCRDKAKIAQALRGEAITWSLAPLARHGISQSEREATFAAWGYANVTGRKDLSALEPGEYAVDDAADAMTIRLLPGIHPHSAFGLMPDGKIFTAAVPGQTHYQGTAVKDLAQQLVAQGAQDVFLWANGKDVAMHAHGFSSVLSEGARPKALELFLVVRKKKSATDAQRRREDMDARLAEIAPPMSGARGRGDAIMARLIAQAGKKSGGRYALSDRHIAADLKRLERKPFLDDGQTQEMIEAVGQRYGFSAPRIPSEYVYKATLYELRARALVWRYLRENGKVSPLTLFRRIEAFREGLDPRIMFEIYLDHWGPVQGREVLTKRLAELDELAGGAHSALTESESRMISRLHLYMHPQDVRDEADMRVVTEEFKKWWRSPKRKSAGDLRPGAIITRLRGVMKRVLVAAKKYELENQSGFPLMRLLLTLRDAGKPEAAGAPESGGAPSHLKPLLRGVQPLLPALSEMAGMSKKPEAAKILYNKSSSEWVDELARRHGFSKRLDVLKRELEDLVLPEDAHVLELLFAMFPSDELLDVWNHVVRVAKLAYLVALEMKMDARERQSLLRATLTHDWGKRDPDIAPLLDLERKLDTNEVNAMRDHGLRSAEIAGSRLSPAERLAVAYHNYVEGATRSEAYKKLCRVSRAEGKRFQRLLYVLYTADFLDAIYDYSRAYVRNRSPLDMRMMPEILRWMEQRLDADKKRHHGKDPIEPRVVAQVRSGFLRIADRAVGKAKSTGPERRRDEMFQEIVDESTPFWALYQLINAEKENYRVWNVENYSLRALDKARALFLQRVSRSKDASLEARASIFSEILERYANVAAVDAEFPLDLYLATMTRFGSPIYQDFQGSLDAVKARVRVKLAPMRLQTLAELRQHVRGALFVEARNYHQDSAQDRDVAALMLGHLGDTKALGLLAGLTRLGPYEKHWKMRRAAVDTIGVITVHLERRLEALETGVAIRYSVVRPDPERNSTNYITAHGLRDIVDENLDVLERVILNDVADKENSRKIRGRAMYLLRDVQSPRVRRIALEAMKITVDKTWRERYLALKVLGRFLDDAVVRRAVLRALADPEVEVRVRASAVLESRPQKDVADALVAALHDGHFDGRYNVLVTLFQVVRKYREGMERNPLRVQIHQKKKAGREDFSAEELAFQAEIARAGALWRATNRLLLSFLHSARDFAGKMTIEEKRLVWMLAHPDRASEAWSSGMSDLAGKKEWQELAEHFFRVPMAQWYRDFGDEKTRPGSPAVWKEIRKLRQAMAGRETFLARKVLQGLDEDAMRVSDSFRREKFTWPMRWVMERLVEWGLVGSHRVEKVLRNIDISSLGYQSVLHLIARAEGISVGILLRRAILHERYHQALAALQDQGFFGNGSVSLEQRLLHGFERLDMTDMSRRKEDIVEPEDLLLEFQRQYEMRDPEALSPLPGAAVAHAARRVKELLLHHYHAKAAEAEGYPSRTDEALQRGNLAVLHESDKLEGLCARFPLKAMNAVAMRVFFEGMVRDRHPAMDIAKREKKVAQWLRRLQRLLQDYPSLHELLQVGSEPAVAGAPAKEQTIHKIRQLTRLVKLLRGDAPRLVLGDKGKFGAKFKEFQALLAQLGALRRAEQWGLAIHFLVQFMDIHDLFAPWDLPALREKPVTTDAAEALMDSQDNRSARIRMLEVLLRKGNREAFISAVFNEWGYDARMSYEVAQTMWQLLRQPDVWGGPRILQNLVPRAVEKGLEEIALVEKDPERWAELVWHFLADPDILRYAGGHPWVGKTPAEILTHRNMMRGEVIGLMDKQRLGLAAVPLLHGLSERWNHRVPQAFWAGQAPVHGQYMHAMMIFLDAVGWMQWESFSKDAVISFPHDGNVALACIKIMADIVAFLPVAADMQKYLFDPAYQKPDGCPELGAMIRRIVEAWSVFSRQRVSGQEIFHRLEGVIALPVLTALWKQGVLNQFDPKTHELEMRKVQGHEERLQEGFDALILVGWAKRSLNGDIIKLTAPGVVAAQSVRLYARAVSRLPDLMRVPYLLSEKTPSVNLGEILMDFLPGYYYLPARARDEGADMLEQSA